MRYAFLFATSLLLSPRVFSQGCCSGGSGSPIAGGASQGVLLDRQMEIGSNFQFISTNKYLAGDADTISGIKSFKSDYLYLRVAYGVTKDFTMSVESGYFLNKTQIGIQDDTLHSSGIGDLILFPRYDVLNRTSEKKRTEITLGMGYKIPLGKYNDSTITYRNPYNGHNTWGVMSPTVQPTNGSHDFIFYGFFYRGFPLKNCRIFANVLYVKKGWNPLGQKFGDYSSIGLFFGKTFFKKLGVTLQIKAEHIAKMKTIKDIDMVALYGLYPEATGARKVFFVPQLSYSYKSFTVYALTEIPIYQYVNYSQVASQYQMTVGLSYRFLTYKTGVVNPDKSKTSAYYCPMCPEVSSEVPGKCPNCGMDLVKRK